MSVDLHVRGVPRLIVIGQTYITGDTRICNELYRALRSGFIRALLIIPLRHSCVSYRTRLVRTPWRMVPEPSVAI